MRKDGNKESMATHNRQAPPSSSGLSSRPRVVTAVVDTPAAGAVAAAAAAGVSSSRWAVAQHGHCLLRAVSPSLSQSFITSVRPSVTPS